MEFNERLKALRMQAKMTQQDLSRLLGVSVVTIRNWEAGLKQPSMAAIIALSKTLCASSDYLLGLKPDTQNQIIPITKAETRLLSDYRVLDYYGKKAVDAVCAVEKERAAANERIIDFAEHTTVRYIPKYFTPSAAGYAVPLDGDEYEMIPVDDSVPNDADFATIAHGESMAPYIHDGDTIFVKNDSELDVGDVGIFIVNGARYCKQYYVDNDRNLTLVSANPALRGSNIYVSAESDTTVTCCGKVLLPENIPLPDYFLEEL